MLAIQGKVNSYGPLDNLPTSAPFRVELNVIMVSIRSWGIVHCDCGQIYQVAWDIWHVHGASRRSSHKNPAHLSWGQTRRDTEHGPLQASRQMAGSSRVLRSRWSCRLLPVSIGSSVFCVTCVQQSLCFNVTTSNVRAHPLLRMAQPSTLIPSRNLLLRIPQITPKNLVIIYLQVIDCAADKLSSIQMKFILRTSNYTSLRLSKYFNALRAV